MNKENMRVNVMLACLVHVVGEEVEHEPVAELGHAQDLPQLVPHVLPRGRDVRAEVAVPQRPEICLAINESFTK